jgi:hypothetical protein
MPRSSKPKEHRIAITPRLTRDLHGRFKKYIAAVGGSESTVVEAALREYLDPARDAVLIRNRLDRLTRFGARIETNGKVTLETLLALVQLWLAHMPEMLPEEVEPAMRRASLRFERFMQDLRAGRFMSSDDPQPGAASQPSSPGTPAAFEGEHGDEGADWVAVTTLSAG